ncbi:MAG: D-alanyl-D-alanine carboxypeptidase [Nitrosomonadales bacterium]|nr:D-alanyl-D-alanine carboxypeptidase [Nitrosomonadales bacterium]
MRWHAIWPLAGCLLGCLLGVSQAAAQDEFPRVAAAYLLKVGDTVLWKKAEHKHLPPASLTKIMTALLVLESADLQTRVVVHADASAESGSRLGLKPGEQLRVADLLAAMLIVSANDACHALADQLAGSEARFVELMNRRASEWGLQDTRFVNACGHDADGHYSSAHDLALLTERALQNEVFAAIVAQRRLEIVLADGSRRFRLENHNALIGRLRGAAGVKSGYTQHAGKCLIALVERGGVRVLLVMLNAPNRWWDADAMLNRAFEQNAHAS